MAVVSRARVRSVRPLWAVEGGRIAIDGDNFPLDSPPLPEVRIGGQFARIVHASPRTLTVVVPAGIDGGRMAVKVEGLAGETPFVDVGTPIASGLHQVDNPAFDRAGNLFVTYSGARGQQAPVSIYRVRPNGAREPFVSGIVNPTSMAFDGQGRLYVSSRFEGTVYRIGADGSYEVVVSDLGVTCGLAFGPGGILFAGDRSGTVFRVATDGRATPFATLPPSVAAFHLAYGPDGCLYVTAPTFSSYDAVYRIDAAGRVQVVNTGFGRPQGLAFDRTGTLYVVEALAGSSGLYRVDPDGHVELVLAGAGLIGVAFDPGGGLVVSSNDTAYRLDVGARGA